MNYLPIFLKSLNQPVAVFGSGTAASRKVDTLLRSNCDVYVYADSLHEELIHRLDAGQIKFVSDQITLTEMSLFKAVIIASDDKNHIEHIWKMAKKSSVPVNVVDHPDLCDFILPAIIDRDPVVVAVSSSGTAPVIARLIKSRIETLLPNHFGKLAAILSSYRKQIVSRVRDGKRRLRLWQKFTEGKVAELVFSGNTTAAKLLIEHLITENSVKTNEKTRGEVYLVGAGPGDPELLTFKALRLMQQADVVLYDRLLGEKILDLVRKDAERIYVGKKKDEHVMPQDEISALLVKLAKEGKRVLRLKGGDPFIFGRGGEEIEVLASAGIDFQVVPGVTAASGCASYSGIPLTHRDHAQSCIFVTGHVKDGEPKLDWKSLIKPNQTLAIYMGLAMLGKITQNLMKHGAASDTEIAVIAEGTRATQKVVTGTLDNIESKVINSEILSPAMIIIGGVVGLRSKLKWFEGAEVKSAPLANRQEIDSSQKINRRELVY